MHAEIGFDHRVGTAVRLAVEQAFARVPSGLDGRNRTGLDPLDAPPAWLTAAKLKRQATASRTGHRVTPVTPDAATLKAA